MASTVELTLNMFLLLEMVKSVEGVDVEAKPRFDININQTSGVTINKQDQAWYDKGRTLAASASEELDLAGGLTDPFGDAITFALIKGIYIKNNSVTAGDILRVGGAASNAFPLFVDTSDKIDVNPGSVLLISDPSLAARTVTASTGDLLKIEEVGGANTVNFDIAIWGTKA